MVVEDTMSRYFDVMVNEIACGSPIENSFIVNFKWFLAKCMHHQMAVYLFCAAGIFLCANSDEFGSSAYARQGFILDKGPINWRDSKKILKCLAPDNAAEWFKMMKGKYLSKSEILMHTDHSTEFINIVDEESAVMGSSVVLIFLRCFLRFYDHFTFDKDRNPTAALIALMSFLYLILPMF